MGKVVEVNSKIRIYAVLLCLSISSSSLYPNPFFPGCDYAPCARWHGGKCVDDSYFCHAAELLSGCFVPLPRMACLFGSGRCLPLIVARWGVFSGLLILIIFSRIDVIEDLSLYWEVLVCSFYVSLFIFFFYFSYINRCLALYIRQKYYILYKK